MPNLFKRRLDYDKVSHVRHAAIRTLGTQIPWSPEILEAILRRLGDDEVIDVRRAAIDAFHKFSIDHDHDGFL